ncbi:MAG: cyclic pyranopterin monophosphate synthase MoaC [Bacilli bacterium]
MKLTHLNEEGLVKMVNVGAKEITNRYAVATGSISMNKATIDLINKDLIGKGNVLGCAQIAGMMALKQTSNLIPMAHPLNISGSEIRFEVGIDEIKCYASAYVEGQTGIEMEVIVGASIALATIYDMCKAVDKEMVIKNIYLLEKKGGKSGHYQREEL